MVIAPNSYGLAIMQNLLRFTLLCFAAIPSFTLAHEGPDPLSHWYLQSKYVKENTLESRLGPNGQLTSPARFVADSSGDSLVFEGRNAGCILAKDLKTAETYLPKREMTVSAWFSIDTRQNWGGILGFIQDNGNSEKGWVLGYDNATFYFALATTGADDGDGKMTYFKTTTEYELGKLYHVAAVFDGTTTELYVNGVKELTSDEQHGDIDYPDTAIYSLGAYVDADENYPHHGRIREIKVYDNAAKAEWVAQEFAHHRMLAQEKANPQEPHFELLVAPYLQFATQTTMTVMWHTSATATSVVHYGETIDCINSTELNPARIHEVRLQDLQPDTQYFYRVESKTPGGKQYKSEVATFRTAVNSETPYAFAVISDTQGNPTVSSQISQLAWEQRPSFVLHSGDLVSTGGNQNHWLEHFFPGMRPLINHVPFYPVLGNHEQNAEHYYNYVSLPAPEYYYTFTYGNCQFFMIDTNQKVAPGSEQYEWLKTSLSESDAQWKFVCHHHPPYSSDENDYGNLWKTNQGTHGDLRARQLVPLYEEFGVDIVWNGHIHSYERTWRVRKGKAVEANAPFYMITGGGGGGLETPAPTRPFFQNNVRRGHHYVMVHVNGGTLELKSYTLNDRLFDQLQIKK